MLPTSQPPEVTQRRNVRTASWRRPRSRRRSACRRPCGSPARRTPRSPVGPLLNSKPICAEAEVVFCGIRTHARFRKTCPSAPSWWRDRRASGRPCWRLRGDHGRAVVVLLGAAREAGVAGRCLGVLDPVNCQPSAVLVAAGTEPCQSRSSDRSCSSRFRRSGAALSTRLPSSSSNPELIPTGPAKAETRTPTPQKPRHRLNRLPGTIPGPSGSTHTSSLCAHAPGPRVVAPLASCAPLPASGPGQSVISTRVSSPPG